MKLLIVNNDLFKKIKPVVKQLLFDEDFIEDVNESIKLFDPICKLINVAQKTDASLAYVAHLWITLKLPAKFNYFADQLERRKKMGLNIYAICTYYLHPKFHDDSKEHLTKCQLRDAQTFLIENLDNDGVLGLSALQEKSGIFGTLFRKKIEDPIAFWNMVLVHHSSLARLALKLQKIPASTAQIERLFSGWSFVHSPNRNRLTFDHSKKLLTVYYTLKFNDSTISDEY